MSYGTCGVGGRTPLALALRSGIDSAESCTDFVILLPEHMI